MTATLDIESLVAKSDLSHTFRADAGTRATNRSPTTWRASRSRIRNWVATKTFKSRKGHANKKQPEKCPKQGYTDVLLDLIRSYCRTSRTGSKSSKSSILWGLGRLWTYLFAASRQLHSNWCLGVPAKQGTNKIKDIYLHMFLHIVYTYFAYIQNIRYVYIYNSLIRFNKDKGKKKEQLNSWGGCVVKLSRFPAICCSRKPTTSSEDGRYWVSPPFTEFTRLMTSLDIAPSKNGRCTLINRINTTNKLRTSLVHTHFNFVSSSVDKFLLKHVTFLEPLELWSKLVELSMKSPTSGFRSWTHRIWIAHQRNAWEGRFRSATLQKEPLGHGYRREGRDVHIFWKHNFLWTCTWISPFDQGLLLNGVVYRLRNFSFY